MRRNMFKNYSKAVREASAQISSQMELDRKSREEIARKEVKARNRVDISLEEYEAMKSEISSLQQQLNQMKNKFKLFNDVAELNIIPGTMDVLSSYDVMNM